MTSPAERWMDEARIIMASHQRLEATVEDIASALLRAREEAWEEGFVAGTSNTRRPPQVGVDQIPFGVGYILTFPPNPYTPRKDRT